MKGHKVSHESVEVAEDVEELVHHVDVGSLFCKSCILSDEVEKGSLLVLLDEFLDCIKAESLDSSACLSSLPACIGSELRAYSSPVCLCEHCLALECDCLDKIELS